MIGPLATEYGGKSAARTGADNATAAITTLATMSFFTWAPVTCPISCEAILTLQDRFDVTIPPQVFEKCVGRSTERRSGDGSRNDSARDWPGRPHQRSLRLTEILLPEHDHASAAAYGAAEIDDGIAAELDAVSGVVAGGKLGRGDTVHRKGGDIVRLIESQGIRAGGRRDVFDHRIGERVDIAKHRLPGSEGGDVPGRKTVSADCNVPMGILRDVRHVQPRGRGPIEENIAGGGVAEDLSAQDLIPGGVGKAETL